MLFSRDCFNLDYEYKCNFKSAEASEDFALPTKEESEIITYPDRITVNTPNIGYQIYTVTGQLIQSGVATLDISTAQLNKGVYILRLENGKTLKVVK